MRIQLPCAEHGLRDKPWALDLERDRAELFGPDGESMGAVTPDAALSLFEMPDYIRRKHFQIRIGKRAWRFDVPRQDLEQIKGFMAQAVVDAGPEAVQAARFRALRDTALGIGCLLAFGVVVAWAIVHQSHDHGGSDIKIRAGTLVAGLGLLSKGIYGFRQYGKMARIESAGATQTPARAPWPLASQA